MVKAHGSWLMAQGSPVGAPGPPQGRGLGGGGSVGGIMIIFFGREKRGKMPKLISTGWALCLCNSTVESSGGKAPQP